MRKRRRLPQQEKWWLQLGACQRLCVPSRRRLGKVVLHCQLRPDSQKLQTGLAMLMATAAQGGRRSRRLRDGPPRSRALHASRLLHSPPTTGICHLLCRLSLWVFQQRCLQWQRKRQKFQRRCLTKQCLQAEVPPLWEPLPRPQDLQSPFRTATGAPLPRRRNRDCKRLRRGYRNQRENCFRSLRSPEVRTQSFGSCGRFPRKLRTGCSKRHHLS